MRLQTEAFNYMPVAAWAIILPIVCVLFLSAILYYWGDRLPTANKVLLYAALFLNTSIMILNILTNLVGGVDADQLNADLKDQLGIEKVSYDRDYRELTGEKDGTVVFCVLAEEGDRGNIYEVICK